MFLQKNFFKGHLKKKRAVTLLELLLVMALITISSSVIGWKISTVLARAELHANLEKLESRFRACRQLAFDLQCDLILTLTKSKDTWSCEIHCEEDIDAAALPTCTLTSIDCKVNGIAKNQYQWIFTANGMLEPSGSITFFGKRKEMIVWSIPQMFFLSFGNKKGPPYPDNQYQ